MVDELAIAELAVEECAPGSLGEHLREAASHAAGLIRERLDAHEQFAIEHVKRDFLGGSRRLFYEQAECGVLRD